MDSMKVIKSFVSSTNLFCFFAGAGCAPPRSALSLSPCPLADAPAPFFFALLCFSFACVDRLTQRTFWGRLAAHMKVTISRSQGQKRQWARAS
jgi:hypothetical protein